MSLQVARSTKLTESSSCCVVAGSVAPALMKRSPASRTRQRPGSAPGTTASWRRRWVQVPKTVRRSRSRNLTALPHGDLLPGEAGVDRLFEYCGGSVRSSGSV